MEVSCERCPLNQYVSIQEAFKLNTSTGEFLPKASCKTCPYGGNCTGVMAPQPNFWRYTHDDDIRFQSCPASYCCKEPPCTQSCREGRQGVLCGKCLHGTSGMCRCVLYDFQKHQKGRYGIIKKTANRPAHSSVVHSADLN